MDTNEYNRFHSRMATPGRLSNPPIQEVLVDIRIATTSPINAAVLEPLKTTFRERYPTSEEQRRMETRLEVKDDHFLGVKGTDVSFSGLFLRPEDRSRVVQFRVDGFTLNQLAGYTIAEDLISEAISLWQAYANAVKPRVVVRIALRYINRLRLPFRHGDPFERFLITPPEMPPGTPQYVATFLTRVVVPVDPAAKVTAIVTQRLEHAINQATPYTLDIDVYREGEFDIAGDGLQRLLLELRHLTDNLFFGFLTDEALEPHR